MESSPKQGDFHALPVVYGQMAHFFGTKIRHFAPTNETELTRLSLDFRIGIEPYFDPKWVNKEAKAQHGRKRIVMH